MLMGKGAKGKARSSPSSAAAAVDDDDSLIAAAIEENRALKEQAEAAAVTSNAAAIASKGLSCDVIVKKLNAVPCFCLLNGEQNIVGLSDPNDSTGTLEVCCWFADPLEAKQTLQACKDANPELSASLHLGVTPLGLAFAFAIGWADCHFFGEKQVRGSRGGFADGADVTAMLREQATAQGLEARSWHVPVFSCDELTSASKTPLFLSRKALAEAWVTSGRKLADLPQNLAVMDLGVVVHQMQQPGGLDWETVVFVCERKAVQLVQEAKKTAYAARNVLAASTSAAPPLQTDAPPLADEDAPPPLE